MLANYDKFIKNKCMYKNNNIKIIEGKLTFVDDSINSISNFISQYREICNSQEEKLVIPVHINSGESLFDGVFQNILCNLNPNFIESSEEVHNFNMILENTSDAIIEIDENNNIIYINPSCLVMFEYDENEIINNSIFNIISNAYMEDFKSRSSGINLSKIEGNEICEEDIHVFRGKTKYGKIITFESFFSSLKVGSKYRKYLIIRDLTYNQSLIDELKKSKDNYAALSDTISEVIIRIDENFNIIYVNYAIQEVMGYKRDEVINKKFNILFPESEFKRFLNDFKKYFYVDFKDRNDMGMKKVIEILGKNKNRGISPLEMSFGNAKDISGRTLTCIIRDITKRKNTERKLKHLAYHDRLTSLGNRDLFDSEIKLLFKDIDENSELLSALFFLDLDGFKQINDTFGHHAGDELLILAAKRLRNSLRDNDKVYRFGGDEFVILISSIRKRAEAAKIASNVLNEIRRPFILNSLVSSKSVNIGVSIGITILPENGSNIENATKNADLAMYKAKDTGKNKYIFYSKDLNAVASERWNIEQGMKLAITNDEIQMYYQPIINENGKIKAIESLIRWFHPERGYISPEKYIPVAEETGFIITMGNWILERSCRDLKAINSTNWGKDLYISINLSARQFDHKDLITSISSVIKRTGVDPNHLRFELTETSIMSAPERVREIMTAVKDLYPGIKFVIDDFGTGYSSLSYLSNLPVDSLKIDLTFVSKLFEKNNQKVVNSIITLAESLELEVVAEGIEDNAQSEYFINKNCNSLQGFLYSKALSLDKLNDYGLKE